MRQLINPLINKKKITNTETRAKYWTDSDAPSYVRKAKAKPFIELTKLTKSD